MPHRTCVACRKVDAKRGLRRLVRIEESRVAVDVSGKRAGRGAYLCVDRSCWELALKRHAIERALKLTQLQAEDRQMLSEYGASLPIGSQEDKVKPAGETET